MTQCGICNTEFCGGSHSAKYCSDECRRWARLNGDRAWRAANREHLREWFRRDRIKQRERYNARERARRDALPKKPPTERVCGLCDAPFLSQHFRAFCSKVCQRRNFNDLRQRQRATAASRPYRPSWTRSLDAPRLCAVCGDAFVGTPQQKVCSLVECQTARKRLDTAIWVRDHPEYFRDWQRRYRQAYPDRIKRNAHNFYVANREWVNEQSRLYRLANLELSNQRAREYGRRVAAAVEWWRENVGPVHRVEGPRILAALMEVEHD